MAAMKALATFRHLTAFLLASLALPEAARAARPELRVLPTAKLSFGSFVVFSQGSRTVSASGAVSSAGIEPAGQDSTYPASFTVNYDRGNESRRPISLVIDIQLMQPPPVTIAGVTGTLSGFTTDLAGAGAISPGQVITIAIDNCTSRQCARSFRIGGRLDVQRSQGGGGTVIIPLTVVATLVSVN